MIGEVIHFDRALTAAEAWIVEAVYLEAKWLGVEPYDEHVAHHALMQR
jgi:hypothetical protein